MGNVAVSLPIEAVLSAIRVRVPPRSLKLNAADLVPRLDEVLARLAEVAEYNGDGDGWELWLACARAAKTGVPGALAKLSAAQGRWLALWGFAREHLEVAFAAYEHYLSRSTTAPNSISNLIYLATSLKHHHEPEAQTAFGRLRKNEQIWDSDEPLLAAVDFRLKKLSRAHVLAVAAEHARSTDPLTQASASIAFDVIGDSKAASEILKKFDADSSFAPLVEKALRERFGERFDEAVRAEHREAKTRAGPIGFVAKKASKSTGHEFAPAAPLGPPCAGCGHLIRTWFSIDVSAVSVLKRLSRVWRRIPAPACLDCDIWMFRHDFAVDAKGKIKLEAVQTAPKRFGKPRSNHSTEPISSQPAKLTKAPQNLDERPLEGHVQVGGNPAWIQEPVEVQCRHCNGAMLFVLRLSSPNSFAGCPEIAGGSGALYYFACSKCRRLSHIAQWT